ncbi:MAG: hypothetical protein ACOVO2_11380 [Emticicia sp.]|uniref:hypothetical protein n=1 Tax=Emticicia sp. TaxID=1930953 RepID=UPI003BA4FF5A
MKNSQDSTLPFSEKELNLIRKDLANHKNKQSALSLTQLEDRSEVKIWSFFGLSIPAIF